jgi:hypothetical protein
VANPHLSRLLTPVGTLRPWPLRTAEGRFPPVRLVPGSDGEAPTYAAAIGCGDPLTGPLVATLSFGYGYDRAEMAQVARRCAAVPTLLTALNALCLAIRSGDDDRIRATYGDAQHELTTLGVIPDPNQDQDQEEAARG